MPSSLRSSGSGVSESAHSNSPASKRMKCEQGSQCVEHTTKSHSQSESESDGRDTKKKEGYEEVTLSQWWEGFHDNEIHTDGSGGGTTNDSSSVTRLPLPLVDLRCNMEYNQRRLNLMKLAPTTSTSTSTSELSPRHTKIVHLPFHTLQSGERSCELPPRHVKFAILLPTTINDDVNADNKTNVTTHTDIIGDSSSAVSNMSQSKKSPEHQSFTRQEMEELFFATRSKATAQTRKPWLVKQVLVDSDTLWEEAKKIGILDTTSTSSNQIECDERNSEGHLRLARKLSRLWEPDRMVENILLPLLRDKMQDFVTTASTSRQFTVWDLGSGAGRDVSFLAEELKSSLKLTQEKQSSAKSINLKVVGIDNHKGSARRCIPLWKNRFVDDVTYSRLQNLNTISTLKEHLQLEKKGLVCLYAIRFLNRKMVEYVANDTEFLHTGCLFAMSHFCKEKDGEWKWDHPKPSSVLDRDELSDLFVKTGHWRVLHNELCSDGDHGRNLLQFVAERCT